MTRPVFQDWDIESCCTFLFWHHFYLPLQDFKDLERPVRLQHISLFLYRTFSSGRIKWTMQSEKGLGAGKGVGHLCFWDVKGNQTGVFWVHLDSGQMLRGHQGIFLLCKGHVYGKPLFPVIRNLIITMIMETCSLLCRLQTTISLWLQDANVGNSATGKFQGATRQWPGAPEAMTRVALVKHHGRRTQNRVG